MRILILLSLVFTITYCAPRIGGGGGGVFPVPSNGGGSSSNNSFNDNNNRGGGDSINNPSDIPYNNPSNAQTSSFCRDNPNAEYCICLDNPNDSRCRNNNNNNNNSSNNQANFRDKHRDLLDRYNAYVDLDDINRGRVEDFLAGHSLNSSVRRARVYFDLDREVTSQPNTYGGSVQILFEPDGDDDVQSLNRNSFRHFSGDGEDVKFNVWANNFRGNRGNLGFHGFFEDRKYGSIIVSIKDVCRWGGESREYAGSGSIWFKRFKSHVGRNERSCYRGGSYLGNGGGPSHPNPPCWLIGIGPYDCQAWSTGNKYVQPNPADREVEPTGSCYEKLGSFSSLNIGEAFGLTGEEDFLRNIRDICR